MSVRLRYRHNNVMFIVTIHDHHINSDRARMLPPSKECNQKNGNQNCGTKFSTAESQSIETSFSF